MPVLVCNNEKEWLEQRKKGIGGSDASAILGLNPWKSSVILWEEKVGLREPDESIANNDCVKYGKAAEQHLRALFELDYPEYQIIYEPYTIYQHPDYPFLQATLDGKLKEINTGRNGILEIKTTEIIRTRQQESWNGKLPDNYFVQILHYMNVVNADFAILKAQLKYRYENDIKTVCRHYKINRSDINITESLKLLQEKEVEFWEKYIVPKKKPPLIITFNEREEF